MSKPLTVVIPHNLGQAEAKKRLEDGLAKLTGDLPGAGEVHQTWNGDRLNFSAAAMGQTISGVIDVLANEVKLEVNLPGFLGMLAGKIRGKVEERGRLLLK
jgi:putative polyhydroxyalkanoate system protein